MENFAHLYGIGIFVNIQWHLIGLTYTYETIYLFDKTVSKSYFPKGVPNTSMFMNIPLYIMLNEASLN